MLRLFGNLRRNIKRLSGNSRGATAVEFALVSPLFFAFIFSLVEAGLLFTRIALVEDATRTASRQIYTGAAQTGGVTQDDLKQIICDNTYGFISCADSITLEVQTITDFSSIPNTNAVCDESDDEINPVVEYTPGATTETTFVRVCVTVPILTPGLGLGLALPKSAGNKYSIVTSLAFENEPF